MRSFLVAVLFAPLLVAAVAVDTEGPTSTKIALGRRADSTLPFNVAHPGTTPAFIRPAVAKLLPVKQVAGLLSATTTQVDSLLARTAADLLTTTNSVVGGLTNTVNNLLCGLLGCVTIPKTPTVPTTPVSGPACLDSTYNDTVISSLFNYGGAGTTVFLCPGAVINLQNAIWMYWPNQTLTTGTGVLGAIIGDNRATLVVQGSSQSVALYSSDPGRDGATVKNLIVNGNRSGLGWLSTGGALLEMGGTNSGQTVTNVKAYEPRGWSALHMIEGNGLSCTGAVVTNNQIGPAGHAPSGAQQFRRKRDTGTYAPGQWADGISLACRNSVVTGNTITDATDGGIVVFQSPGSTISGNTIIADQRQLLGGINAVDYYPYGGPYTNTQIINNNIVSKSSMIKIGMAVGTLSWGSYNSTDYRTSAGTYSNNIFSSGNDGYFGFGVTVAGITGGIVQGNTFVGANFGGVLTGACILPIPTFGPLYQNPYTTPSTTLQSSFVDGGAFQFAICTGPGDQIITGLSQLA
ncbi:hypothetical protein BCR35DRAFT_171718 [Leucosporidium creatinivorum]|uniref:Right handed beta helix domain-containing protein n=1 Tax=Leucosporidium creatinivorum TaxID=106004 RepID=A0A1Y2E9Q0_9BASI|nr:hypothetical protein BCR35DRAFT_171718 [Leucosporidium creatinivorum]